MFSIALGHRSERALIAHSLAVFFLGMLIAFSALRSGSTSDFLFRRNWRKIQHEKMNPEFASGITVPRQLHAHTNPVHQYKAVLGIELGGLAMREVLGVIMMLTSLCIRWNRCRRCNLLSTRPSTRDCARRRIHCMLLP